MSNPNRKLSHADILKVPAPRYTSDQVLSFIHNKYDLSGQLSPMDSERDQNFLLDSPIRGQYVVKISNRAVDPAVLDMQLKGLDHIARVDPGLPVPRLVKSHNGSALEYILDEDGGRNCIHVLTFLPGRYPRDFLSTRDLLRPIGSCLARLVLALRGFFHPSASYELLWDLKQAEKLKDYLHYIQDPDQHDLVKYFLDRFIQLVLPEIPKLRGQIVHNDFAPHNILVAPDDPGKITGIIDFGDMIYSLLATDLATSIAQMLVGEEDPVEAAGEIILAFHEVIPLEPAEVRLLYDLVATRLAMLNVIASWRVTLHPENRDYIVGGVASNWEVLYRWRALDPGEVTKRFLRICGYWELEPEMLPWKKSAESRETHLSRRSRLLGSYYYLFYKKPLHLVRGQGVWVYDQDGKRYLDVYNNVPHVGHCHPHVVRAIHDQSRKLNTSTRYMHDLILELSERLTSKLPEPLSVCTYVCTGSEANELAWRMAKLVSGNRGALITNFSYHGNGDATIKFSSEEIPGEKLPGHVKMIEPPRSDSSFNQPDSGLSEAIASLQSGGYNPAMLILDTGFTSNGIFTSPPGYLKPLAEGTRAAGGLFVADEVQAGFARLGDHFWGFEYDDVVPDIVTMGKPMGNGHPVAAVVTRPEVADALAADTGYFNTFGGNPVSCAAALAVLDVIEAEDLQQNSQDGGIFLRNNFLSLKFDYPHLGNIHGSGLLLGLEVIKSDGTPDPEKADFIKNFMREYGVLVGTTGPQANVLKIRPPIIFNQEHAEILLNTLRDALEVC